MDNKNVKKGFSSLNELGSRLDPEAQQSEKNVSLKPKENKTVFNLTSSIGNFFSIIFGVLLLIPLQLYAIALVGGGLYYYSTSKDRELEPFKRDLSFFLRKEHETVIVPDLIPGVLPIDLDSREVDAIYFSLKDTYKPKSVSDVSTVVGFKCTNQALGSYTDGTSAYQKSCDIYVIRTSDHSWSRLGTFTGSEPPNTKKGSGSKTGSHPVKDYLRKAGITE